MNCHQQSCSASGDLVEFHFSIPGKGLCQKLEPSSTDREVAVTKGGIHYRDISSDLNQKPKDHERQFQLEAGTEVPVKKSRNMLALDVLPFDPTKAAAKIFYKTKLCKYFQLGICPYPENCHYAHDNEELRDPHPNWQEIMSSGKKEHTRSSMEEEHAGSLETRNVFQIPVANFHHERDVAMVKQPCWSFLTLKFCRDGVNCPFSHDECLSKRESEAICLIPSPIVSCGYKTKICRHWEETGRCFYRNNCHFAHGVTELRSNRFGSKKLQLGSTSADNASVPPAHHSSHAGTTSQKLPEMAPKTGDVHICKWKGPDKISKIYGDWIDDL